MNNSFVCKNMIKDINNVFLVADTNNSVDLRKLICHFLLIAFGKTTGHNDLFYSTLFLKLNEFKDSLNCLLLCRLNKPAGINNCNIGKSRLCYQFVSSFSEFIKHSFGIHQILGASQRNHSDFNRHKLPSLFFQKIFYSFINVIIVISGSYKSVFSLIH